MSVDRWRGIDREPPAPLLLDLSEEVLDDVGDLPRVLLGQQYRVVVGPGEEALRAQVQYFRHGVPGFVGDEGIVAREEPLRRPDERNGTPDASHFGSGRAREEARLRVLLRRFARSLGRVASVYPLEVVEVVVGEVRRQIFEGEVLLGEPVVEVLFRGFEYHVEAPKGPL